jgi:DNA-binding FrmR family transcriptional regulator
MKTNPSILEKRNQRITARLRRIQGQVAAIERSLVTKPDCTTLLQRIAAARGAMNGLMADLIEEQLRTLQTDGANDDAREAIEETIDVVHAYLTPR